MNIIKRDGSIQEFNIDKIIAAVYKAMLAVHHGSLEDARDIASKVKSSIEQSFINDGSPTVEQIQDFVEEELMKSDFHDVAKSYILYRGQHAQLRKRDIFSRRINIKPVDYPELLEYVDAIRHSYWIHTEFNFTSDIQDFKINITDTERNAIIEQAADRQVYIDQGQSLNLMINPSLPTKEINNFYIRAWKLGIKTLYYQHSINAAQELSRKKICINCQA